jgi:trans-aconitate methyltransferase|tara:strand:+ start:2100 stop:2780 length:681 start_codon:yes stop_codon:yes gene_type:complete
MNQSLFLESRNLFVNPPVDFEDWGNFDYDKAFGIDKYCYNAYRHFILPYITDPTKQTVMDINSGKGCGIAGLKREFGFKKSIGFTGSTNLLHHCKDIWDEKGLSFYKDFILSKQGKADFIFSYEAFEDYDNKSALLLRLSQALNDNGYLIIIQSSFNQTEYQNYELVLEKTHGLKKLYSGDISQHVLNGIKQFEYYQDGSMSILHSRFSKNLTRHEYYINVSIFQR